MLLSSTVGMLSAPRWTSGRGLPLGCVKVESGLATFLHRLMALFLLNCCPNPEKYTGYLGRPFPKTLQAGCCNPQNEATDTCLVGWVHESGATMTTQAFMWGCGRYHSQQENLRLASLSGRDTWRVCAQPRCMEVNLTPSTCLRIHFSQFLNTQPPSLNLSWNSFWTLLEFHLFNQHLN